MGALKRVKMAETSTLRIGERIYGATDERAAVESGEVSSVNEVCEVWRRLASW